MKKITLIIYVILFCGRIFSQTEKIPYELQRIIQCEIDNWRNEMCFFDTSCVYINWIKDSTGSIDIRIEEFGKDGYQIDSSAVKYLDNGKKLLLKRPVPIRFSEPLMINNNAVVRWKTIHINKGDWSCYYMWEDEFDPRGIKKRKSELETCYILEKGYYYFDTLNIIRCLESSFIQRKDTIQEITVNGFNIAVTNKDDSFFIVFNTENSYLKWTVTAENVFITNTNSDSFAVIISTYWPNYMELSFRVNKEKKLQYYFKEKICTYNTSTYDWEYHTIMNIDCNTTPWVIKEICGDTSLVGDF